MQISQLKTFIEQQNNPENESQPTMTGEPDGRGILLEEEDAVSRALNIPPNAGHREEKTETRWISTYPPFSHLTFPSKSYEQHPN